MKMLTALLLLISISPLGGEMLETKCYLLKFVWNCPEDYVSCENLTASLLERSTKNAVELKGTIVHALASDCVTPSRILGYNLNKEELRI